MRIEEDPSTIFSQAFDPFAPQSGCPDCPQKIRIRNIKSVVIGDSSVFVLSKESATNRNKIGVEMESLLGGTGIFFVIQCKKIAKVEKI